MEPSKKPISFSIYICPIENQWNSGEIGNSLKNVSYFTKNWSLPHMTLTSFSEYDQFFSFEKITKDLEDMIAETKDPQFDFNEY